MKLLSLMGILAMQLVSAQYTRFVYQVATTPDSTNAESRKTELAYLDTDGKQSGFYAENTVRRDSLMERMRATRTFDPSQMESLRSNINYTVKKDLADQKVTFSNRIGRDNYTYEETSPMKWKILPETVKIGEYKTQKAETIYGGRTWYAWFTMELSYQDGPYKFCGLPGLIVKVQDEKGDYSFDLIQVKKLAELPSVDQRRFGQDIKITRDKYRTVLAKFQKDPEGYMNAERQTMGRGPGGGGPGGRPPGGGGGPDQSRMKEMRDRMLKEIKSNNNPIELK
ncbi:GLPGLI family protein [Weeksellaceae bacterium A-14]